MIYICISAALFLLVSIICIILLVRKTREISKMETAMLELLSDRNQYVTTLNTLNRTILSIDANLKKIDSKGSFESDDEIGFFFEEVKKMQQELMLYTTTK